MYIYIYTYIYTYTYIYIHMYFFCWNHTYAVAIAIIATMIIIYHYFNRFCRDIPWKIGLKKRPFLSSEGTSNKSVPVAWPLIDYCWYIQSKPYPQAAAVGCATAQRRNSREYQPVSSAVAPGVGWKRWERWKVDWCFKNLIDIPSGYSI